MAGVTNPHPRQWSLPCTAPTMPSIHWRGWTHSPGSCGASPPAAASSATVGIRFRIRARTSVKVGQVSTLATTLGSHRLLAV